MSFGSSKQCSITGMQLQINQRRISAISNIETETAKIKCSGKVL